MSLEDLPRQTIINLLASFGGHRVRIFGSIARGTAGRDSDMDLLVEFERPLSLLERARLMNALEALVGVPVDIVDEALLRPEMRSWIQAEARPL